MRYRIVFRNTATKEFYIFVEEDSGGERFYRFPKPKGLSHGEYEYYIIDAFGRLSLDENDFRSSTIEGERVLVYDSGVAQIGKIKRTTQNYDVVKNYEEYGKTN